MTLWIHVFGHGRWFLPSLRPLGFRSDHQRCEGTAEEVPIAPHSSCHLRLLQTTFQGQQTMRAVKEPRADGLWVLRCHSHSHFVHPWCSEAAEIGLSMQNLFLWVQGASWNNPFWSTCVHMVRMRFRIETSMFNFGTTNTCQVFGTSQQA